LLRLSTEGSDRPVSEFTFDPCASYDFSSTVQIDGAGSYTIKLIATDSTGLTSEHDIAVTATGATPKCAYANVFDMNGVHMLNVQGQNNDNGFLSTTRVLPYGHIFLKCPTPGAVIHFQFTNPYGGGMGKVFTGGNTITSWDPYVYAINSTMPAYTGPDYTFCTVWVTAAGYADGDVLTFYLTGHG
jgi:hypothetical protein